MEINLMKSGDVNIINCEGVFETPECRELSDAVKGLINNKQYKMVINLSKTTFFCSSGWGAILASLKQSRLGGGDILVAEMSKEAEAGFFMANFNEILRYYPTVKDAIEAF